MRNSLFTTKRIFEIHKMFAEGSLIVDNRYQRNSVWGEKDKVRLIETILLDFVVPELFFWKAETNPATGESITHIVDGQQRIRAVSEFANGKFKLSERYLMNEESKRLFKDKFFSDLSTELQKYFWDYYFVVIEIDPNASEDNIKELFYRLNLTNYSLNDQEKRHSMSGLFGELAEEISRDSFWGKFKIFNESDRNRMKNVEFCANLIILYQRGIIDQVTQQALNEAYVDMQTNYTNRDHDREAITEAISNIESLLISQEMILFSRRKTQLYSLFSLFFMMKERGENFNSDKIQYLDIFVKLYSRFRNDSNLFDKINPNEKEIFNLLNRYKLASSEGARKAVNRIIRCNILYTVANELNEDQIRAMQSLKTVLNNDLSNVEEEDKDEDK